MTINNLREHNYKGRQTYARYFIQELSPNQRIRVYRRCGKPKPLKDGEFIAQLKQKADKQIFL